MVLTVGLLLAVLIAQLAQIAGLIVLLRAQREGGGGKTPAISHISSIVPPHSPQNFPQNGAPQGSIHYADDDLAAIAVREGKAVDDEFFDLEPDGD